MLLKQLKISLQFMNKVLLSKKWTKIICPFPERQFQLAISRRIGHLENINERRLVALFQIDIPVTILLVCPKLRLFVLTLQEKSRSMTYRFHISLLSPKIIRRLLFVFLYLQRKELVAIDQIMKSRIKQNLNLKKIIFSTWQRTDDSQE